MTTIQIFNENVAKRLYTIGGNERAKNRWFFVLFIAIIYSWAIWK